MASMSICFAECFSSASTGPVMRIANKYVMIIYVKRIDTSLRVMLF